MMRITAIGVGGAFTERFYHTNYVVEIPGLRMLIDAGTTLRYSLRAAGYTVKDIDRIVITHFHSDHVGGLEELAQRCRYLYQHRPSIYVMADQFPLLESLFALHGTKIEDYLNIINTEKQIAIADSDEGQFQLEYYSTRGLHATVTSNYIISLRRLDKYNKSSQVIFTGDIGPIEQSVLGSLVADPDTVAVFHDCYTGKVPTRDHPSLEQLEKFYPPEQRSKIYLIHYGDNILGYAEYIRNTGFKLAIQGVTVPC